MIDDKGQVVLSSYWNILCGLSLVRIVVVFRYLSLGMIAGLVHLHELCYTTLTCDNLSDFQFRNKTVRALS